MIQNSDIACSATNPPPWVSPYPPPGRPGVALCCSVYGLSIFAVTFSSKPPVRLFDCLKPTSTQPATSYYIPQHPHNIQTKPQAPEDGHRQERISCETGIEELVDERWTEGLLAPTLPLLSPPPRPFNDKDTDPPYATIIQASHRTRKSRFSTFPDERAHLLPVHIGDQTLPPMGDHIAAPCHSPTLSHWILVTSPTTTHPGTQWDQPAAPRTSLYGL